MKDKTKKQLIDELSELRKQIGELEKSETKRKQDEQALRESEEKFKNIIQSSPMGMHLYQLEPDGRLIFIGANPAADNILGVDNAQFVGKTIEEAFPPLQNTEVPERYRQAAAEGESWSTVEITYEDEKIKGAYEVYAFQTSPGKMAAMFLDITESKRAEEALRESEEKYRGIFESLHDVYYRTDREGRIIIISPSVRAQTGYDPEDIIGHHVTDFYLNPSDREIFTSRLKEFGILNDYELQLKAKDGRVIEVSISSKITYGEDGSPVGVDGILRDITERKRVEEALRTSEEKFSKAFRNNPDSLYITTIPEGKFVDVNPAFETTSGYSKDEVLGKTVLELDFYISPDDRVKLMQQLQKDGRLHDYEISFRIKSGEILLCRVFSEIIEIQEKPHLLSIVRDITEQKKAEDDLKSSEERLKILFKYAPDAYYLSDLKGNFIDGNLAAEDLLGYKKSELIGKRFLKLKLLSAKEVSKAVKLLAKNALGKGTGPDEFTITRKDGTTVITEIRTYPVKIKEQTLVLGIARDITERKEAEQTLRESLQTSDDIVNSIPTGLFIYQFEPPNKLILLNGNPESEKLTGVKVKDWIGREFDEIWPEAKKRGITDAYLKVMETGKTFSTEDLYYKDQSLEGAFRIRAFRIPGERLAVAFENIAGRKQAEEALRESEDRFRTLSEASFEGIAISDKGYIIDTNEQITQMFGYEKTELIGKPVFDLVAPESRVLVKRNIESGYERPYEHLALHNDGKIIPVEVMGRSIPYKGRSVRVTAIRDITERKKAEEALQESEERYRTMAETSPDGVTTTDLEGSIAYASQRTAEALGFERAEDLIGRSIFEFIAPEDQKMAKGNMIKTLKEGMSLNEAYIFVRKDGTQFPGELSAAVIRDDLGNPQGFISISRDISDRKKIEKEIQDYQEKLRSLASTLSLTEQRERRNIATFVHDQISQKLALAKIKLGALNESLQSTEHNKPVKDIRDLIEETVQDTRNLTFDLSPPILYELGLEQSLEWLADQFTEKYDLAFTFRDDNKPKPLDEDIRVVLFQAARELLMNAIKHSQAKTVKIATLRENGNIRLSVEDDGIGFDTSITQPYWVKTGGFGLFNIRERLDQFRGEFKIQSQPGKGTKATLIAPLKQDESKDNKNASASKN
jgi:PAS domain S-box-containing protein